MQYAYEKLMQEYELSHSELPEDAKLGIEAIKNIEKAVNMAEKSGKKINPQTMAKIKANDKWVVREILDYVDEFKGVAPNTYKVLFDNFDEDDDNGVETNRYKLIETDEEIFTISKK